MLEKVKVLSLIGQNHDEGNLWFALDDPETPNRLFNYFMDNVEYGDKVEVVLEEVSKEDFDRDED